MLNATKNTGHSRRINLGNDINAHQGLAPMKYIKISFCAKG